MKNCPFCAEEIQDAAIVCKHCGRELSSEQDSVVLASPPAPSETAKKSRLELIEWRSEGKIALGKVLRLFLGLFLPCAFVVVGMIASDEEFIAYASFWGPIGFFICTKGNRGPRLFGSLLLFIVILVLFGVTAPDPEPGSASPSEGTSETEESSAETELFDARVMTRVLCEAAVEERLVSPGTADFPFMGPRVQAIRPPGNYRWQSYVDSQNALGGTIRSNFICDTRGAGDNPSDWTITNFVIE